MSEKKYKSINKLTHLPCMIFWILEILFFLLRHYFTLVVLATLIFSLPPLLITDFIYTTYPPMYAVICSIQFFFPSTRLPFTRISPILLTTSLLSLFSLPTSQSFQSILSFIFLAMSALLANFFSIHLLKHSVESSYATHSP